MSNMGLKRISGINANVFEIAQLTREGVVIGSFAGFNSDGSYMVSLPDEPHSVIALSTVVLGIGDAGAEVAVTFENSKARGPIIIGRVMDQNISAKPVAKVDGERVVLKAEKEIELRCGEASIILTKAGKVLIRGNFVLSRSRGANKIKGAFVDIN